jgi:ATP-dependent DNA helicase RecQ
MGAVSFDAERARALLRTGTDQPVAAFRDGQEDAIRHVVEGHGRLLVVQRTGWGKSFVYFIAARLLREAGLGPTLLISPLLSLMRNQLTAAARMGVRAATINSDNRDDWRAVTARLHAGDIDVLVISPERLANEQFATEVLAAVAPRIALLVVDEAHCISDWGHDFRPHYRLIERILRALPASLRVLATTATANDRVLADLREVLGPALHVIRGDLDRPSLVLQTIALPDQAERLAWLAANLPAMPGAGIVYTLTIADAERVAAWLRSRGIDARPYSSASEQRDALEQALLANQLKVLVATTALGMGFDKPDLGFVVHYQMPGSVVAYYQQVGRAGRAIPAYGVLLAGAEDARILEFFVESAFPSREEAAQVLAALDRGEALSIYDLMAALNLSRGRIEKTLALLALESPAPLVKVDGTWQLTAAELTPAFWDRAARLTALRQEEQREMQRYVQLRAGHMRFLIEALDGDGARIGAPTLPPLPERVDEGLVREAVAFLRRSELPIPPRKQWPAGGLPAYVLKGKIAPGLRAEPGRALCVWGDAGWGTLVRDGKYVHHRFDDALVTACEAMVRRWAPHPAATWVTCIPSRRHPTLVLDFAHRLAHALGLPFAAMLAKTDDRAEQKTMANSTKQARNVDGAFALVGSLPAGPVLLVDDLVDSGWTLTVAAWLLRSQGGGEVWPLALARARGGE